MMATNSNELQPDRPIPRAADRPFVNLAIGGTRIVFLCGNLAFKFPRLRLIKFLSIVSERLHRSDPLEYGSRRSGRMNVLQAVGHLLELVFLAGFLSNTRESYRWYQTRSLTLTPILFRLPLGILNVQERVTPLSSLSTSASLVRDLNDHQDRHDARDCNLGYDEQGHEVWLDYGGYCHPLDSTIAQLKSPLSQHSPRRRLPGGEG